MKCIGKALEFDVNDANTWYERGNAFFKLGKDEAEQTGQWTTTFATLVNTLLLFDLEYDDFLIRCSSDSC